MESDHNCYQSRYLNCPLPSTGSDNNQGNPLPSTGLITKPSERNETDPAKKEKNRRFVARTETSTFNPSLSARFHWLCIFEFIGEHPIRTFCGGHSMIIPPSQPISLDPCFSCPMFQVLISFNP